MFLHSISFYTRRKVPPFYVLVSIIYLSHKVIKANIIFVTDLLKVKLDEILQFMFHQFV